MSMERAAEEWVRAIHPHALHLVTARDWVVRLTPDASEELRLAAILHDIERAFPDPEQSWDPATAWEDPTYLRWHQDRCADIAASWLAEKGAGPDRVRRVQELIRVHEEGGWEEADVLQAADSLSFFDTLTDLTVAWAKRGYAGSAERKLRYTLERIRFAPARAAAADRLTVALAALPATPGAPSPQA